MRVVRLMAAIAVITHLMIAWADADLTGKKPDPTAEPPRNTSPDAPRSRSESTSVTPDNIKPLYTEPEMPGEGVWVKVDPSPEEKDPALLYRTFYRPSEKYPNAIAYMLLFNMKRISPRLYLGSGEPKREDSPSRIEEDRLPRLVAITNALWQSRHAGKGGIILDGKELKKMAPGVATLVFYEDDSVDILEWDDEIPLDAVRDARQLKHLILKRGEVITTRIKRGKKVSAEIGLGSLLNEAQPVIKVPPAKEGGKPTYKLNLTTDDPLWFIATRSAFGVRPDGNLVFAVGRHISTVDLAKALALAGCVRAMHGDANPGNAVGVIYLRNKDGKIVRKERLSPQQAKCTVDRYLQGSYPKDFIGYFRKK